jgi:hypothetical protein
MKPTTKIVFSLALAFATIAAFGMLQPQATLTVSEYQIPTGIVPNEVSLEECVANRVDFQGTGEVDVLNTGIVVVEIGGVATCNKYGTVITVTEPEWIAFELELRDWYLLDEYRAEYLAKDESERCSLDTLYAVKTLQGEVSIIFEPGDVAVISVVSKDYEVAFYVQELSHELYMASVLCAMAADPQEPEEVEPKGPSCKAGPCPGTGSNCSITCPKNKAALCYCKGGVAICKCIDKPRPKKEPAQNAQMAAFGMLATSVSERVDYATSDAYMDILNTGIVVVGTGRTVTVNDDGSHTMSYAEAVAFEFDEFDAHLLNQYQVEYLEKDESERCSPGILHAVASLAGTVSIVFEAGDVPLISLFNEDGETVLAFYAQDLTAELYDASVPCAMQMAVQGAAQEGAQQPVGGIKKKVTASCHAGPCPISGAECSIECPEGYAALCYCNGEVPVCQCIPEPKEEKAEAEMHGHLQD